MKSQKAITLIALVITIIVLLILAGITINLTIGERGIITRAQEAGKNYVNAQEKEEYELNKFENEMDNILNNTKLIYNKSDLEKVRDEINNGDTYEGKTIKLMNDIDLQGTEENQWIPINDFDGTFDGNYYSIKNIFIKGESYNCSFVRKLNDTGIIKKLKLENVYIDNVEDKSRSAGGIVGTSFGNIEECSVSGIIRTTSPETKYCDYIVGGIVANNSGVINKCSSNVSITEGKQYTYAGGICGLMYNGVIKNCYNIGNIRNNETFIGTGSIGGIVGQVRAKKDNIENCYNVGNIEGATDISEIGTWGKNRTGLIGSVYSDLGIIWNNCYCLEGTSRVSVIYNNNSYEQENYKTEEELKKLAKELGEDYTEDVYDINKGYPILKWQKNNIGTIKYKEYTVGEEVTINGETFYVMKDSPENESAVTLLAKDNIATATLKQSASAGTRAFSVTNYWSSETKYPYELNRGANNGKYDSNITDTSAIGCAERYGTSFGATGRLMTKAEADTLQTLNKDILYGINGKSSSTFLKYWLGSATNAAIMWRVDGDVGQLGNGGYNNWELYGVRPVIEISKSLI